MQDKPQSSSNIISNTSNSSRSSRFSHHMMLWASPCLNKLALLLHLQPHSPLQHRRRPNQSPQAAGRQAWRQHLSQQEQALLFHAAPAPVFRAVPAVLLLLLLCWCWLVACTGWPPAWRTSCVMQGHPLSAQHGASRPAAPLLVLMQVARYQVLWAALSVLMPLLQLHNSAVTAAAAAQPAPVMPQQRAGVA